MNISCESTLTVPATGAIAGGLTESPIFMEAAQSHNRAIRWSNP